MRIVEAAVLMSIATILASCAGSMVDRPRPPDYAVTVGQDNDYEVDCGASLVIVDRNSSQDFFNADGSAKTRQQFCDEYRGDTLINR